MRVEVRAGCVILVCEDEFEANALDPVGTPDESITAKLRLSDGYGEFYLLLPRKASGTPIPRTTYDFSKDGGSTFGKTSGRIIRK